MKSWYYAAMPLAALLVLSVGLVSNDNAFGQRKSASLISMDEVQNIVRPGAEVTITGIVTTGEEEPIPDAAVTIYFATSEPRLIPVATGVTGLEGTFEVVWNVELLPIERALTDVTQKVDSQIGELFAQFEGNDRFAASKTGKTTITIDVNSLTTFVNTDKKLYREGETAIVVIGFVDEDDEFVDPDSINANFNLSPVTEEIEQKKVGSYSYVTPPLQRGHNQVTVVPAKAGYNIEAEAVTITVLTSGSVGVFELP
jgi:hypothetical protein